MKIFLSILIYLLMAKTGFGQTEWSSAILGAAQHDLPYQFSNVVSKNGDITVAGSFITSIVGPNGTIASHGHRDMMVARYSAGGQLLWLKTGGGPWDDDANSIAEDNEGNIYVTGSFTDTAYFDNVPLYCRDTIHADPSFRSDVFVIKYDSQGNQKWIKRGGSIWDDHGRSIVIDRFDNIYITGIAGTSYHFLPIPNSHATFDSTQMPLPNAPFSGAMFITKYDTSGAVKWVKSAIVSPWGMTVDDTGNLYITGIYGGAVIYFDSVRIPNLPVRPSNLFVVKYDSAGHAKWANGAGGQYNTYCTSIAVDKAGSVYIAGQVESGLTFFSNGVVLYGTDMRDNAFMAKYGSSGELAWAKTADINPGASSHMQGGLVLDKDANIYVAGAFTNYAVFKGDTIQGYGAKDIMVCKYDSSGSPIWFTSAGSSSEDNCNDMSMDSAGDLYVTGVIGGPTAEFGSNTLMNNSGNWNMFIAKLVQWPLGVMEVPHFTGAVSIYPNPSSGQFSVGIRNGGFTKAVITNMAGSVVMSAAVLKGAKEFSINRPDLPNGVYSLELQGNNQHTSLPFIIKH